MNAVLDELFNFSGPRQHRWHKSLQKRSLPVSKHIADFCELQYSKYREYFDSNFRREFYENTPNRFSELFFFSSFLNAGWQPIAAPLGADFAFSRTDFSGRLLLEVITPAPPPSTEGSVEKVNDQITLLSPTDLDKLNTYSRLTSALRDKAAIIEKRLLEGHLKSQDYKCIGISGIRINQEAVWSLETYYDLPDWLSAFLPIGPLQIDINVPRDSTADLSSSAPYHAYQDKISRPLKTELDKDDLLSGKYPNVDAIVYSGMVLNEHLAETCHIQTEVVHNPTSSWQGHRPNLGFGADYEVNSTSTHFGVKNRNKNLKPEQA